MRKAHLIKLCLEYIIYEVYGGSPKADRVYHSWIKYTSFSYLTFSSVNIFFSLCQPVTATSTQTIFLFLNIIWDILMQAKLEEREGKSISSFFNTVDLQCCINFWCTAKWFYFTFFYIFFSFTVYYRIEHGSLCCMVGPYCSPILYTVVVCIC